MITVIETIGSMALQPALLDNVRVWDTDSIEPQLAGFSLPTLNNGTEQVAGMSSQDISPAVAPTLPVATPTIAARAETETEPQPTQTPIPIVAPTQLPSPTVAATSAPEKPQDVIEAADAPITSKPNDLNEGVNRWREQQGLPSLSVDASLCEFARTRAREIAGNFSHDGFTAMNEAGTFDELNYTSLAENIWMGTDPQLENVIQGWEESPGHRKAMAGSFTYGCGVVEGNYASYLFMSR